MSPQKSTDALPRIDASSDPSTGLRVHVSEQSAGGRSFRPEVFSFGPACLNGMRCGNCDRVSFPARESCPACGALEPLHSHSLSKVGRLCSWTTVRNAPPGLRTPYTLAYVDLPADRVRVMAQLCDVDDVELAVGLPLELTSISVRSTRVDTAEVPEDVHMFAFRPSPREDR
jgi:uncharacterized protein